MDNWDDVKFVLALARQGTMTAAAQALGTNVATVSRRIDRITEDAATPLFLKKDGSWIATDTARGFVRAAEEFDALIRAERNNAHAAVGRTDQVVRISAMPFVHSHILIPALPLLYQRRPSARLVIQDGRGSLGLGDTDIALRFGRPVAGRLVARKVADLSFRTYRSAVGESADWVSLGPDSSEHFDGMSDDRLGMHAPTIQCDTFEEVCSVIRNGRHRGVLPDILGRTADGVVRDEGVIERVETEIWAVFHQSRRADLALRAIADWIGEAFAASSWASERDDLEFEIAAE